jgi:predicted nucleic acid-binding protein
MNIVIDACSLILLSKATVIETALGNYNIATTSHAYGEVLKGKEKMFADALLVERLNKEKKIKLVMPDTELFNKLAKDFNMGKGEASVIAACVEEKGSIVATDNKQGRKAASVNALPLIGSVEIVVDLFRRKKLDYEKADKALESLGKTGWFDMYLIEKAKEDIQNERS